MNGVIDCDKHLVAKADAKNKKVSIVLINRSF